MPLPSPTCARRRHRPRSRSTGASAGHERVLRLCHRAAIFISTCPRPPQAGRRADSRHGRRHGRRRARRDPCRDPSCSIQWRGVRTARDGLPRAAWAARASLGLSSPRVGAPKRPSRPPIRPTRCCRLQEGRREATWPSRLQPSGPSWPPGPPPAAWWSAPRSRRLPWLCPSEWALPQGRIGWRRRRAGRLCRPPAAAHPRTFAFHPFVCSCRVLPAAVKPALLTAASNLLLALPSHAEAGKIFGEPPVAAQRAMGAAGGSAALRSRARLCRRCSAACAPRRLMGPAPRRPLQTSTRPCRS